MPMRRESSTTTRDKENGHLLTQRGKSGALRKEDTPRVHSVVRRTIDWMWRNLRYLIGQHKHSENPVAVEASRNFESKGRSAITQLRRKMKANKKPKVMKTKRKGTKRLSIWARFVSKESQKLKLEQRNDELPITHSVNQKRTDQPPTMTWKKAEKHSLCQCKPHLPCVMK
ncbi:Hypp5415 [Branchiostoma lanceolatum]|uniref:Hypp5415 protein n=1 Tax=Branchiostoma lanceolatum TaxID=7740 RepID=A0A8K0EZG7_BRALA|nr:Hypp5415 [Branchiostoma lanceolatum]